MKKTILIIVGILVANIALFANGDQKSTLTVVVKNLQNKEGNVAVTLFDKEEKFLKDGLKKTTIINSEGHVTVTFDNIANGVYAVAVIHDVNANDELDTILFGIPSEPYGFSNNARGQFGPPSFEDSKFEVGANKKIEISVE